MPYSAISNAEIDPDSPVTTGLMTKMRDNPEAIAQGLSGATKVNHAAFSSRITNAWTYNLALAATQSSVTTHNASVSFSDSTAGQKYIVSCSAFNCGAVELRINGTLFHTSATAVFFAETLSPPAGASTIAFTINRAWDNANSEYYAANVSIQIVHLAA